MSALDQIALLTGPVLGPPAPRWLGFAARALSLTILILVGHWVSACLGGVASGPVSDGKGGNDTSLMFNWHPILMTLAFAVFMSEAVLTYQAPAISLQRPERKKVHYIAHSLAAFCIVFGLLAVFNSHNLKLPTPMANLYSPHSFLGLTCVCLFGLQFLLGLTSYLYPQASLTFRQSFGPIHRFLGLCTWVMGLATMASGFQEKVTFVQMGKNLSGSDLASAIIRIPATVVLLLGVLALLVTYHQVPSAAAASGGTLPASHDPALSREEDRLLGHGSRVNNEDL